MLDDKASGLTLDETYKAENTKGNSHTGPVRGKGTPLGSSCRRLAQRYHFPAIRWCLSALLPAAPDAQRWVLKSKNNIDTVNTIGYTFSN